VVPVITGLLGAAIGRVTTEVKIKKGEYKKNVSTE
jgi:hypothetical protein